MKINTFHRLLVSFFNVFKFVSFFILLDVLSHLFTYIELMTCCKVAIK